MIQSKQDLNHYLFEDLKRFNNRKPNLKDWLLKNEGAYIYKYIKTLRYVEYHLNTHHKLLYLYYFRYKRMCFNLKVDIKPNNLGPGFRLMHLGMLVRIKRNCRIGRNCTILPGVIIGNKNLEGDESWVTIGANAVVTKDIPDNAIVAGIPARIIKYNI